MEQWDHLSYEFRETGGIFNHRKRYEPARGFVLRHIDFCIYAEHFEQSHPHKIMLGFCFKSFAGDLLRFECATSRPNHREHDRVYGNPFLVGGNM